MTEPQNPNPKDDIWKEFDAAEAAKNERLEHDYQVIEGYNATMLNQIAGLEDTVFQLQGEITEDGLDPTSGPNELRGKSLMSLLYLRPDRQQELYEQGETGEYAENNGNPYIIRGEVPERTQKLIDDLFASTGATKDKERSTPTWEVWKGDVAGQPIEFDVHKKTLKLMRGDREEVLPTLAIYANKGGRDLPAEIGQTVAGAAISSGMRVMDRGKDVTDAALDDLSESAQEAAADALKSIKRKQGRRDFWQKVKRRVIFPERRSY